MHPSSRHASLFPQTSQHKLHNSHHGILSSSPAMLLGYHTVTAPLTLRPDVLCAWIDVSGCCCLGSCCSSCCREVGSPDLLVAAPGALEVVVRAVVAGAVMLPRPTVTSGSGCCCSAAKTVRGMRPRSRCAVDGRSVATELDPTLQVKATSIMK